MPGHTSSRRTVALVLLGIGFVVSTVGCSAGSENSGAARIDVVTQVEDRLDTVGLRVDPGSLTCDDTLPAVQGQSVRCGFTTAGQPVDLVATADRVDGSQVDLAVTTEAVAVPRAVLAASVGDQVSVQMGTTVSASDCAGDLQPEVGASATCTLSNDGVDRTYLVTVDSVDGGLVTYSIGNP